MRHTSMFLAALALSVLTGCTGGAAVTAGTVDDDTGGTDGLVDAGELPAQFQKFAATVTVYRDGDYVVVESDAVPNHGSPYFAVGDSRYEAYNGSNDFRPNPSTIAAQDLVFRIPVSPVEAAAKQATPGGAIGVSLNGVPFFNQYAAGGAALDNEIVGFDQYNGHPQQQGMYHYHVEPLYLTATEGKDALLGFLLDGFPVYGPQEGGTAVSNDDLDDYHGHFGVTVDYPDGIYHYHVTDADPYINGSGFYGVPGTVSQ